METLHPGISMVDSSGKPPSKQDRRVKKAVRLAAWAAISEDLDLDRLAADDDSKRGMTITEIITGCGLDQRPGVGDAKHIHQTYRRDIEAALVVAGWRHVVSWTRPPGGGVDVRWLPASAPTPPNSRPGPRMLPEGWDVAELAQRLPPGCKYAMTELLLASDIAASASPAERRELAIYEGTVRGTTIGASLRAAGWSTDASGLRWLHPEHGQQIGDRPR